MRKLLRVLLLVLFTMAALFIVMNWHEVGHTVLARLAGDPQATYRLYRNDAQGNWTVGANMYDDTKLSAMGNILVVLGGIIFTQIAALALLIWRRRGIRQGTWHTLNAIMIWAFLFDLPFQALQVLAVDVARNHRMTGTDLAAFAWLVRETTGTGFAATKIMLACFACLCLIGASILFRTKWPQYRR